jgi:hypothetical protein
MVQSLYSLSTCVVTLSAPPVFTTQTINSSVKIQGITRVVINYNNLSFNSNPFKVKITWPDASPIVINDIYTADNVIDPLLTFSPTNSGLSQTVLTPQANIITPKQATIQIYYENGTILTYVIAFYIAPDNIIDLDLNVLSIQNENTKYSTVYNLQSNRDNIIYNIKDETSYV